MATIIAITLAACGGSDKPSPTTTTAASARHSTMLAVAACMRRNGVPNFPDPTAGSGGIQIQNNNGNMTVNGVSVNAPAFNAAMKKCQSLMPAPKPVSEAQLASIRSGALKMAKCMRANGVPDFPDPVVRLGPGGRGIEMQVGAPAAGGGGTLSPQSPAFQTAQQKCQKYMQAGPNTSSTSKG
jgi:hypothetical protein